MHDVLKEDLVEDPIYTFIEFKNKLKYFKNVQEGYMEIKFKGCYRVDGLLDDFIMRYSIGLYDYNSKKTIFDYEIRNLYHQYLQKVAWER